MTEEFSPFLGAIQPDVWLPTVTGLGFAAVSLGIGFLAFSVFTRRRPDAEPADAAGPPVFKFPAKVPEKRGFTRRSGNAVAVFYTKADHAGEPHRGCVLDRSTGGLRLSVDNSVEPGTILRVRPCITQDTAPWVDVEVKSCRADQATWELGCQFVKAPSYNVLLLFG